MKKAIFLSILILSISTIFCSAKELKPIKTVVSGKVINMQPSHQSVVTVNFCDPIRSSRGDKEVSKIDPQGNFNTEYSMVFSQNITIAYDNKFINVFVEPGDSIHVLIDMAKFSKNDFSGLVFTGAKSKINNQLASYCYYFYRLKMPKLDPDLEPDEFLAQIKQVRTQMEDSISVYAKKHKLDPFILKWAKIDLKYLIANNMLGYSSKDPVKALKVFTDPIFDSYNSDNFVTMLYQYHLVSVVQKLLMADPKFAEYMKAREMENSVLYGLSVLSKLPANTSRDIMIYMFVNRAIAADVSLYEKLPKDLFVNTLFADKLRESYDNTKVVSFPAIDLKGVLYLDGDKVVSVEQGDLLAQLTSKYQGKVLYIDVWATWCGPCRAEFPYAKKLHELFKDKDVVFVNLCLSSDLKDWQPTVSQFNVGGENYFLDDDATALFMANYGLSGYPSYILVGKDGKIVTKKAPRPTDISSTHRRIEELLIK